MSIQLQLDHWPEGRRPLTGEQRRARLPDSVLWLPWLLLKSLSRFRVIATLSLALLNLSSRICARATL